MPTIKPLTLTAIMLVLTLSAAACQPTESAPPTSTVNYTATALVRASWTTVPEVVAVTPTATLTPSLVPPTVTPTPVPPTNTLTATPTPTATATLTPSTTPLPTNTRRPTITLTPSQAVTQISSLVPGVLGGDSETWTPMPVEQTFQDHFLFQRPIGDDHNTYWARNYSYGSTDHLTRPVHHGVDLENEAGTPVLAAAYGFVYYAGPDIDILFGPQPNFYGNVIVLEHTNKDALGRKIYTLYGHLSMIEVKLGQTVKVGQEIGQVGSAGVAIGSHLHFEVRAGEPENYNAVLNPELWVLPFYDYGVVAGRVLDLSGNKISGVLVEAQSASVYRSGYSYGDNSVNGDPVMGENFAIPDLPEGYYNVFVKKDGTMLYRSLIYIGAGHTSWVDIHIVLP